MLNPIEANNIINEFTNEAFEALVMIDIQGESNKTLFVNEYVNNCCRLYEQGAFLDNSNSIPDEDLVLDRRLLS